MAFSQKTKDAALQRSGGRCECTRKSCRHHLGSRCTRRLENGWEAHHKTSLESGGNDTLSNCEALCPQCHENTRTYGG